VLAGFNGTLLMDNAPERIECTRASVDAIPMTGIAPLLGRAFLPAEDRPGGANVTVLSYELWQRRFRGDRQVLGTSIKIDDQRYSVVGVMPPNYGMWGGELWIPYQLDLAAANRSDRQVRVAAILQKELTEAQANARLQELAQRMAREHSGTNPEYEGMTMDVRNITEWVVRGVKPSLMLLLAAVGLLVLVSCANLGSLLLSRASTRRREIAVRAALGARRWRIARQLIVESLTLSFLGGAVGVLLALWGVPTAVSLVPYLPNAEQASLTSGALIAAMGVTFAMGVLFGTAPAFYGARTNLSAAFKEGSGQAGIGASGHLLRNVLVVSEIAISLIILAGAVLMIRTYQRLVRLDIGFQPQQLLSMEVTLPESRYRDAMSFPEFYRQLMPRLRALPGVQGAAAVTGHPLIDRTVDAAMQDFAVEGRQGDQNVGNANYRVITPDYFQVTGTRLLSGRYFSDQDNADHPSVAIVNKTMADLFWPKEGPVGRRILLGARSGVFTNAEHEVGIWVTIVGVVDDAKQIRVIEAPVRQEMFFPVWQRSRSRNMTLMLRSAADQAALTDAARHAIQSVDPELPIHEVFSMEQLVSDSFGPKRLTTVLLVFFALAAVTLAVMGLYAVMAYSVTQRTREIGVRMALGARPRDVLLTMLKQGLQLGVAGLALGLLASMIATKALRSLFIDIDTGDPITLAAVCAGLGLVVLLASYVPAYRATKVDPMVALRHE